MIGDVGDEEKGGKANAVNMAARCSLTRLARMKQKPVTRAMAERALSVRKEKQVGARNIGGRMIIDEPAEEEAGDGADGDNGGDDAERGTVLVGRKYRHGGKAKIIGFLLLTTV